MRNRRGTHARADRRGCKMKDGSPGMQRVWGTRALLQAIQTTNVSVEVVRRIWMTVVAVDARLTPRAAARAPSRYPKDESEFR